MTLQPEEQVRVRLGDSAAVPLGAQNHQPDMRDPRDDLVVQALTGTSAQFAHWCPAQWTLLCQQARHAGLLARAGERLRQTFATTSGTSPWPANLDGHLAAAERVVRAQRAEVERELRHIAQALAGLGAPVVVLKGAAYLAAGLPPGRSRVFSDVDILVPKEALAEAESQLMLHGWTGTHHNAYDQRYYRQWMHELPPLQHMRRGTTLDLHHNILPSTARLKPDGARLVEAAMPLPDRPGLHVLAPPDMVLHAMTHLFMNEEMSHALRDLSDLDLLLRHFSGDAGFWDRLLDRAGTLDLRRPLFYGVRQLRHVLGTPMPPSFAQQADSLGPPGPMRPLMDALWRRALRSPHPNTALPGTSAALLALYVRGHWLRMPPLMLARHLTIKALRLHQSTSDTESPPNEG